MLNKEQAIAFYENGLWKDMTHRQRAEFQLLTERLCMPFGVFHEAIEVALDRPVYTHEFGLHWDRLQAELHSEADPPSLEDILGMIPEDKLVIVMAAGQAR